MSQEELEGIISENFKKAFSQYTEGCGRQECLNPYCAKSLETLLNRNKAAAELLALCKKAHHGDIAQHPDFFYCDPPKRTYSGETFDPQQLFVDPLVLAQSFVLGKITNSEPSVDFLGFRNAVQRTLDLVENEQLDPAQIDSFFENYELTDYLKLYMPRLGILLLGCSLFEDFDRYTGLAKTGQMLVKSKNLSVFTNYLEVLETEEFLRIFHNIQQFIAIKVLGQFNNRDMTEVQYLLEVLKCLYDSNEKTHRIDFKEFYNDAVNKDYDLKKDYKSWVQKTKFCFAKYPWIFDTNAKSTFLGFESKTQMTRELHRGMMFLDPYMRLEVRRENLIEDTLSQLVSGELNLKKPLRVHFVGEEGVDEGGLQKEFFQLIVKEIFDPSFSMFKYFEDQRLYWFNPDTFEPNINFELIGTVLGMAIYNSVILDVHLPMAAYKKLLQFGTNIEDLREFDPDLVQGFDKLLAYEGNVEDLCMYFVVQTEAFGGVQVHELKPGGAQIPVTNETKQEYVDLYVNWWLEKGIKEQFEAFKRGFFRIYRGEVIKMFKPEELELLVCGNPLLDFHELERVTIYEEGYTKDHPTVRNFWKVVHSLDENQKRKFLSFCTGSDRAPVDGLGSMKFVIMRNGPDSNRLMTAHTCFNHLLLPEYQGEEKMSKMIVLAIENASGFGLR